MGGGSSRDEGFAASLHDAVVGLDKAVRRLRWSIRFSLTALVLIFVGVAIYVR